ncbi:aryl-sulfate sulfotransferase [Zhengella mangrovi]|uniref:Aryl-sulfate sulfotransferase n=1 Tax=Zhengella mangrovi TaxID=1982044 RepID=A0A2G1QQR1_9HYPH|nr:ribbon-helix-helix domain-containing protein [Zhengella mangrovi]PHP67558.1 aryl-sulfate sulfotransferase [Zhengella mangrovi]
MSGVRKRSVTIRGHRTSFSVEDAFYAELLRMASEQALPFAALIAQVDEQRDRQTNLSSALRLAVLNDLRAKTGAP